MPIEKNNIPHLCPVYVLVPGQRNTMSILKGITINQLGLLCIFVVGACSQHVGLDDSSNVVVTSEHGVKITGTSVEVGHDITSTPPHPLIDFQIADFN